MGSANNTREELKYIGSVVRALVTSRKPPVTVNDVLRDYCDVEGSQIPYKKLGYTSAISLLEATDEFSIRSINGLNCISAKYNAKTEHIASMVRSQKRGKKVSSISVKPPYPAKRTLYNPNKSCNDQSWNKSNYSSNVYQREQQELQQKYRQQLQTQETKYQQELQLQRQQYEQQLQKKNQENNELLALRERCALLLVEQEKYKEKHDRFSKLEKDFEAQRKRYEQELAEKQKELRYEQAQQKAEITNRIQELEEETKNLHNERTSRLQALEQELTRIKQQEKRQENDEVVNAYTKQKQQPSVEELHNCAASSTDRINRCAGGRKVIIDSYQDIQIKIENKRMATSNGGADGGGMDLRDKLNAKYKKQHQQQKPSQGSNSSKDADAASKMRPILGANNRTNLASNNNQRNSNNNRHSSTTNNNNKMTGGVGGGGNINGNKLKTATNGGVGISQKYSTNGNRERAAAGNVKSQSHPMAAATAANSTSTASVTRPTVSKAQITTPTSSIQDRLKLKTANSDDQSAILTPPATPQSAPPLSGVIIVAQQESVSRMTPTPAYQPRRGLVSPVHEFVPPAPASIISQSLLRYNPKSSDPVITLAQYCVERGYNPPEYKFFETKSLFHCRVTIDEQIFSSYPHELPDKLCAKVKTAEIAIAKLREIDSRRFLPTCMFSDAELIDRLYHELLKHPNGIITKNMEQWFEKTFGSQLPGHWWSLIENSKKFKTETGLAGYLIIFANNDVNVISPPVTPGRMGGSHATSQLPPTIQLPWNYCSEGWLALVTHCRSTVEIWMRLFGPEYNDRYEALTRDLDIYMSRQQQRPQRIELQQVYVVRHGDQWHRVRVENVQESEGTANCFYVDLGDTDTLPLKELFVCAPSFLTLASQAICCSLFGLEDFADHPHAITTLESIIFKSVVAKPCSNEMEFMSNGSCAQGELPVDGGQRRAHLRMVLYDTSGPVDDINVNHLLLECICNETPRPQLKLEQKLNPVLVSHISDRGDLYILLPNKDLKYVQRLIALIVASKFKREQHRVTYTDLQRDNLFLICDDISNPSGETRWYRGMLSEKPHSERDEAFDIYYVDDGRMRSTHISKIFRLESLSMALSKFPAQALRVRMHGIPPISQEIVARARGLLAPNTEALVKVITCASDRIPLVTVITRGQEGVLFSINDTISFEHELECSAREVNGSDDDIDKHSFLARSDSRSSTKSPQNTLTEMTRELQITKSPQRLPSGDLPPLREFEAIPAVASYFEIRVSFAANPMHFAVQAYKDIEQLNSLKRQLEDYYPKNSEILPLSAIKVGEAYVVRTPDSLCHRAVVFKIYGDIIHLKLCDCGDQTVLKYDQLRTLPMSMRQLPKMAVSAQLWGIKSFANGWTKEDSSRFRDLTLGKKYIAVVHKSNGSGGDGLNLELIDTSTDVDIRIHDLFITEKRALPSTAN